MALATILVVEDETIVARDVATRLSRRGYAVCGIAATADEAVALAGERKPDLVLMDIMLKGDVDGIAAANQIRDTHGLPVVFITAYADEQTLQRAKVSDAFGYILKPFEERELHITIEMALYKHRMEARLRESEQWLSTILHSIGDGIIAADTGGRITFMNPVAEQLTGWTLAEASSRQVSDVFTTSYEQGDRAGQEHTILVARTGKRTPIDDSAAPIKDHRGNIKGIVVVFRDVTEQRHAEEALRVSEERVAAIIASAMDAIITVDSNQRIVLFNAAAEQMFRCSAAEALRKPLETFLPGRHREAHRQHIGKFRDSGMTKRRMGELGRVMGLRTDGSEFPVEASISQIRTGGEHFYTVILRDITERLHAEEVIRESEEKYRRFFEEDLTGDYSATADGKILEWNPAFARIFGFTGTEQPGALLLPALYNSSREWEAFRSALLARGKVEYHEKDMVRRDGTAIHVVENAILQTDAQGRVAGFKGYMFDDTQRQRLEEQLRQAHKMESIGTLASGIAHDFNNILNNVIGFVMQIKKHAHEPDKVIKYGQTIEKSAMRGAELSSQLLSFARKGKRERTVVLMPQLVDEVASLSTETFPRSITIHKQVAEDVLPVMGDHGELYQVLLNLCVNARDAILASGPSQAGTITIAVRNVRVGETIEPHLLAAEGIDHVELRVTDTGIGIPREIREKIFDPFFTTKERGRGTGLGLSVVYTIIRNHRGTILVDSEPGEGSTFRVYLPVALDTVSEKTETTPTTIPRGEHEQVLIVDDEESMQELGRELLEEAGYEVLIASTGMEALEIFREKHRQISLVILDLVMPGMDGGQTYLELKKINPDLKALFCTGYMPDQVISALLEEEKLQAIQKPFNPDMFVRIVRNVMHAE